MFTNYRQKNPLRICRLLSGAPQKRIGTWVLALGLAGCSLQSDYKTPSLSDTAQWSSANTPALAAISAPANWWTVLHDPAIDKLVEASYIANPTLDKAVATMDEARAQVSVNRADFLPVLTANGKITKANTKITSGGGNGGSAVVGSQGMIVGDTRNSNIGPSLSWELDLFGRIRSSVEAAQRRLDARTADAENTKLSLAVQVANTVLDWRACTHTLRVNEEEIISRQKTLQLIQQKTAAGFTAPVDAASVERDLAAVQGAMAAQQETCTRDVNALVELSGKPREIVLSHLAARLAPATAANKSIPFMPVPPDTALQLPASVLLTHPSVIAADRDAAAAWAEIGTARAERFPKIDLSAVLNYQWIAVGGSTIGLTSWTLGPGLAATLFDGGKGAANVDASEARYRQAAANLQATVRSTVKEVENALAAQQSAVTRMESSQRAATAAKMAFTATEAQWNMGLASLLELEDARRQYATAQDNVIIAARDHATAWVGLVNATANSVTLTQSTPHEPDPIP